MSHNPHPTIIPMPEFPPSGVTRFGGVARYHCPMGCGWWHDEPTDPGSQPLILPQGFTPEDVSSAISLNAEARGIAFQARVEQAIVGHYSERHPEA